MTKPIIIDASLALKWYLKEEYSEVALHILDLFKSSEIDLIAPPIMLLEIINGLLAATLVKRLSAKEAEHSIRTFMKLKIKEKNLTGDKYNLGMFFIAQKYKISVYDSSYAALAEAEHCDFYTADKKLYNQVSKVKKNSLVKWIEEFKK